MIKRLIAVTVAIAALAFPSTTGAWTQWNYPTSGYAWLGPGIYDYDCIWYWTQAQCSGWNYWDDNSINREAQNGTILLGYENNDRIRGSWEGPSVFADTVYPGDVGMGGYIIAHATWWSGDAVNLHVWANSY